MRFSVLGWVENRLSIRAPDSGLTMKRCAEAGLRSAEGISIRCAAPEILFNAEASASGLPEISPPNRSAEYSRVRLIIIWISIAARGARMTDSSTPMIPNPFRSRPPMPPKKNPNCASIEIAPATVAATVMISVSRFFTCPSSCASTPASSSRLSIRMMPVVAATAALSGLRPVAKAFGCSLSMT